jgi:multidrug efflux system outer membrane protein
LALQLNGNHRFRLAGLILTIALMPLLDACAMTGTKTDLHVGLPAAYRYSSKDSAKPLSAEWAALFGSPELTHLVSLALRDNLDIAAAIARIDQANAQVRISSAPLYPILTASGEAARTQTPGTVRSKIGPFRPSDNNLVFAGATASYEVDLWDKNHSLVRSADQLAEASRFDKDAIALLTSASVANAYFTVLAAQDRLRIAQNNIQTATRVLDAIKGRLSVGTATALDVAQQESVVATQRAAIPPLEQQLQQSKVAIVVLVGRPPETLPVRGGSLARLRTPSIRAGLPSQLLQRRPDVAEAEAKLAAQNANVDAARAAFFPTLQLSGRAFLESAVLRNLFRPDALLAAAAADVMQPIFDGYNLQGQYDLQRGRDDELIQIYRKAILTALSDVENALVAVEQTTRHEQLQAEVVRASRRAYEITEQRLREGTIDIVTVLTTELTLFQAEDSLAQFRLARYQAIVSLIQALGGGWTAPPLPNLFHPVITPIPAASKTAQIGEQL